MFKNSILIIGRIWALMLFAPLVYDCYLLLFSEDDIDAPNGRMILYFTLYVIAGVIWYYIIKQKRKEKLKIYTWEHVIMFIYSVTALTGFFYLLFMAFIMYIFSGDLQL